MRNKALGHHMSSYRDGFLLLRIWKLTKITLSVYTPLHTYPTHKSVVRLIIHSDIHHSTSKSNYIDSTGSLNIQRLSCLKFHTQRFQSQITSKTHDLNEHQLCMR